jgi:hypothetical protein
MLTWSNGDTIKKGSEFKRQSYKYRGLDPKNRIILAQGKNCIALDLYKHTNLINTILHKQMWNKMARNCRI